MGWDSSDLALASGEPSPSPGTTCCQSRSSSNTHVVSALAVCPHAPITIPSSAECRKLIQTTKADWQPPRHGTLAQWGNTSTDRRRDSVCIWSSGTSRLTQQGWQGELSCSHVPCTPSMVSSCAGALASPSLLAQGCLDCCAELSYLPAIHTFPLNGNLYVAPWYLSFPPRSDPLFLCQRCHPYREGPATAP